jgi:CRP/FNR family transcriptional regulator, cyclic AMP receptor protein
MIRFYEYSKEAVAMVDPNFFNDVPIFELLDEEERKVLADQVSIREFKAGQIIFQAGDPGGLAYLVRKGLVHVTIKDANFEDAIVDVADDGSLVGMSSLMAGENHQTTAIATEDTIAIEIDRNDIIVLLNAKPMAGLDMMTIVEKQLRVAHELMGKRISKNPNEEIEDQETFGEKMADGVAKFGGSWGFVITFAVILIVYISLNSILHYRWDPYPYILLNLFLSMLAAIQAPVIMMSQNRQDSKDRVRSELDYRVNLKAELEIEEILHRVGKIENILVEHTNEDD